MPNWCSNSITITGDKKTISGIRRVIESIKKGEGEEPGVFATLVGREPHITEAQYKGGAWYDSNFNYWGTKWDVSYDDCNFQYSDEEISLHPETAWSPPIGFCEMMVKEYKKIRIHIFYSEPGCDFSGETDIYLDEEGILCSDDTEYSYTEGIYFLDKDMFWSEVESTIDSHLDEDNPKTAEEFADDYFTYVDEEDKKEIMEMYEEQLKTT
jgi:hypothetical protein